MMCQARARLLPMGGGGGPVALKPHSEVIYKHIGKRVAEPLIPIAVPKTDLRSGIHLEGNTDE